LGLREGGMIGPSSPPGRRQGISVGVMWESSAAFGIEPECVPVAFNPNGRVYDYLE
jgi:hypothetical protein